MAQVIGRERCSTLIVSKPLRFYLVTAGDDKRLKSMLYRFGKHTHTSRMDVPFDAAIFWADYSFGQVTPFLYGSRAMPGTKINLELDRKWLAEFRNIPVNKPKIGIGRGAHFLNAMSGGRSWQRVDGHNEATLHHDIKNLLTGELVMAPSNHVAMMKTGDGGETILTANKSTKLEDDSEVVCCPNNFYDPEMIYYEHTNSMCVEADPSTLGYQKYTEQFFELMDTACNLSKSP